MFSLEQLKVNDRALGCVANLAQLSEHWNKRHAIVDQLLRASEGNGRRAEADRGKFFESAESSVMKVNTYLQLIQRR